MRAVISVQALPMSADGPGDDLLRSRATPAARRRLILLVLLGRDVGGELDERNAYVPPVGDHGLGADLQADDLNKA